MSNAILLVLFADLHFVIVALTLAWVRLAHVASNSTGVSEGSFADGALKSLFYFFLLLYAANLIV